MNKLLHNVNYLQSRYVCKSKKINKLKSTTIFEETKNNPLKGIVGIYLQIVVRF